MSYYQYPGGCPPMYMPPYYQEAYPYYPQEDLTLENILKVNRGKLANVYMSFPNSTFGSKIYKGVIESASKDCVVLCDPANNVRYVLPITYMNYCTLDEQIAYREEAK